jgi:beta-lactamase regulating signal transducer with metallopeptidase domain
MNAMEMLTGPLAQAIGWALLHLLWQATIVAGILAAVLALIPRESATARYGAACSALALVFALFVATTIRAYDPAVAPVQTTATEEESVHVPLARIPAVIVATAAASWRDRAIDAVASARQSLPTVVAAWFLGVLFLSSRLLISWLRARRLVNHGAVPATRDWQQVAERLSAALGLTRAVRLLESAAVEVPSVIGTLRPAILLPASTLTGLTPDQLEMVLAHELAHIRRHDFLMNLLQAFVETLMFYHPAVWWMSGRVRIERENCCDDLAVAVCGNPLQYAKALTRLEELRAGDLQVVVAANGGSLLDRIRRIASGRAESTSVSSRWAAAIATLAILGLALAIPSVPALAQRDETPKPAASKMDVVVPAAEPEEATEAEDADDADDVSDDEYVSVDDEDLVGTPVPPMPPLPMSAIGPMAFNDLDIDVDVDVDDVGADIGEPAEDENEADDDERDRQREERREARREERREDRRDTPRADGRLTVKELIALRAHDITPEDIRKARELFPNASIEAITGLYAVGVTPEFVTEMRAAGLQVRNAGDATGLKAVGVTPEFVRGMRDAGFPLTHASEATGMRAVGVTPEFVRGMRDAGLAIKSGHDVTGLRAMDVTPEYIKSMLDAGVKIRKASDATGLKAMGVTPQFVKQLADAGYTDLSVSELTGMAAQGVDADFIREMEKYREKQ